MSRVAALALALAGLAAGGCGANADKTEAESEGLSVVGLDEAKGTLELRFRRQGRTIGYHLRLGPKMEAPPSAEELAQSPELPTYEVDARVVDGNGQPLHIQVGGHAPADPDLMAAPMGDFDELGRHQDIRLAGEAVPALRRLRVPVALEQLRLAAIQISQGLQETHEKPGLAVPSSAQMINLLAQNGNPLASGPSSIVKWDFIVRKKCFPSCGAGNHSAVLLRGWNRGASPTVEPRVVFTLASCNHGTCASDTNVMSNHCIMPGFRNDDGTHTRFFHINGCSTRYNVTSVWGHNCNDDSELQGRAIFHDSAQSTSGGSCNSFGAHNWAPGCSY